MGTRLHTTEEECNPRVCVVPCAGGGEGRLDVWGASDFAGYPIGYKLNVFRQEQV